MFLCIRLICEVAGKLEGLSYNDLSCMLGAAALDYEQIYFLLNMIANPKEIEMKKFA